MLSLKRNMAERVIKNQKAERTKEINPIIMINH